MKILVVDDSVTVRRIIVNTLKTIGYSDLVEASHGKEALEKLNDGGIQFIITDWNMPEMNGLDFIKIVRDKSKWADMPILMITTRSSENDVLAALQAKVNSYIVKPFTPQELKAKMDDVLKTVKS